MGVIVAALLVFVGFMAGSRWIRYNDEADMQGSWFVYGTNVPLAFKDGSIVINDSTSYAYRIDPTAKTIEYSLGNLAGGGRYWFNDDRTMLIVTDGSDYTMWSTLADDVSYGFSCLLGNDDLPATDASIVLTRSVVQVDSPANAGGNQGEEASQATGEAQDGSSKDNSKDILMVSDIMMDEDDYSYE